MDFNTDIEALRQRFHSGDESAHEDLIDLLTTYVSRILRRAARQPDSESPVIRGIRRLAGRTRDGCRDTADLPTASELSRLLCDELLRARPGSGRTARALETIQRLSRGTVASVHSPP